MNVEKIDKRDKEILYSLDFHARDSVSNLAKKLRMNEDTLNYRIKRLEKVGVIKSYYIVPDTTRLGLVSYKIMLKYQNTTNKIEKEIVDYLESSEDTGWVVKTEGYYDIMFIVWAKNEFVFERFFSAFLDKFSQYFYIRDIVILTENHACQKAYLSWKKDVEKEEVFYAGEPKNICNEVDLMIIDALTKDARVPSVALAKKIGLTPEAIGYRIRLLKKNGAIGTFRPRIDLNKIGYYYYNVLFRLKRTSSISRLFSYARQKPNITYFVRYLGSYDVGFDIEIESPGKFRGILEEIRTLFGEEIINFNYVSIYDEVKITY